MQQTKRMHAVTLNVYDLNAANDWTHGAGVGFYHSGVEVAGREWTFGSGSGSGTGVVEHRPRETGLPLRESILLGETELSITEIEAQAWDLGRDVFQAARYNLLLLNCNHFAAAYAEALGVAPLPGWVNRAAFFGSWVACLLPKRLLTDSAVGGDPSAAGTQAMRPATQAFSGTGRQIGSAGSSRAGGIDESRSAMRERAVQAALARERAQAQVGQSVE
mmetsp:Transcript_8411/g.16909  ORF Transcript_8411/g.16909 Transcript_8411/m.16909 type:complete len:219 (-) Transcript_8411:35-691(-)|eukprot:CAMPEP_0119080762 /NCGR_PEP_ID=MMETSP1178-20130426/113571_1 /TAXON_ID=33656 /ORGANISM="unid sp, Strain CCMP2000" /LENGTH=218 /DNA_ID=CAMNT_0007063395 /DNA_START=80 /DNA_END=736 /DNA_ORIENTATION=+